MPFGIPVPIPQFGLTSEGDVRNVLVVVIDDLGREQIRSSGKAADSAGFAPQPNLDALAARGVTFTRAYSAPACSMTRACAQTGRYGFHGGWGSLIESSQQPILLDETCLPRMITQATGGVTRSACFGKWHVSTFANGRERHPVLSGYERWRGSLRNLERGSEDYYSWNRVEDDRGGPGPVVRRCDRWAVSQNVDDCLEWVSEVKENWFAWVALNVPHTPYQRPPAGLYDESLYSLPTRDPANSAIGTVTPYFKAMIQAMDTEIGRLLDGLGADVLGSTYVIVLADNGTTGGVVHSPYSAAHAKGTVYELGCNVPLIVAGPTVDLPGRSCSELVHVVDLPKTIVELLGGDWTKVTTKTPYDGVSFRNFVESRSAPVGRASVYLETFSPNGPNLNAAADGQRAMVGPQYKLVWKQPGVTLPDTTSPVSEFYDLLADPNETVNLTPAGSTAPLTAPQLAQYNSLASAAATLLST